MKTDSRKSYSCPGFAPVLANTKGEARSLFKQQLRELNNLTFHPQKVTRLPIGFTVTEKTELDRLYEAFQKDREEDGGKWPEYTGDGK